MRKSEKAGPEKAGPWTVAVKVRSRWTRRDVEPRDVARQRAQSRGKIKICRRFRRSASRSVNTH